MNKKVIVIAAVSKNGVYAEGNKIPWYLPEDLQHFKELTTGHTVIMGRKTWESLPLKVWLLPDRKKKDKEKSDRYIYRFSCVITYVRRSAFIFP